MGTYVVRRILIALVVLVVISMLNFGFINLAPGDPLQALLPPEALRTGVGRLYEDAGLADSIPVRYVRWLNAVAHGNLGESFQSGDTTTSLIARTLPRTLLLTGSALALSIVIGVPLGILSALKNRSMLDEIITVWSFVFTSVPGFFLALLAVFFFAVRLNWFPTGGMYDYDKTGDLGNLLHHLILPMTVLGLLHVPVFVRYVRASMLDVARQDYIRTARAKGLRERAVIWRHTFPNALSPFLTVLGLSLPGLVGSSVLIEQVFAWPGMGRLSINAALFRDYPVFMGTSLLYAVAVLVSNLLTDLAYAAVDPRIRYS
jgi:peptide/nickel transport system permease protein